MNQNRHGLSLATPRVTTLLMLLALLLSCVQARAGLLPYATMPGAVTSNTYTLHVNGEPVFVEKFGDVSYARFAFVGRADLKVTASAAITAVTISPLSYGIAPVLADGDLSFSLTQPRKLILRINALEKLLIFAEGPERDAPVAGAPGVIEVTHYLVPGRDPAIAVTEELQRAIDAVSTSNGGAGGVLVFPDGLYMSAQLKLRSRVRLHLNSGALLRAVPDFTTANYPGQEADDSAFLYGQNLDQVSITGRGTLDGNGFQMRTNGPRDGNCKLVRFKTSTNLVLRDFYARDSARWSFHFLDSDYVLAQNLKVMNDFRITTGPRPFVSNTDGFDIDASADVRVEGNFIYTVDDAVTPKVTSYLQADKPTQDILIRNNVIWTHKSAMKVGLEANDDIHDIRFDSNDIVFADRLIALWNGGRHDIHGIRVTHNRTETIGYKNDRSFFSFWINHNPPGTLHDITVNGLYALLPGLRPSLLEGYDLDHRIEDFTIRNMIVAGTPVRRIEDIPLTLGNAFVSTPTVIAPGDDGPPTVQVLADDDYGIEAADSASFLLSRAGALDAPLTVQFSLGGTAVEGSDYLSTGDMVSFAAGAQQARVLIEPLADAVLEGEETVVLQLLGSPSYQLDAFANETLSLADATAPPPPPPHSTLSLAVLDGAADEAGDSAQVSIRRNGDTSLALTVFFSLGGSAVHDQDYSDPGASLVLPAGASNATLTLSALADTLIEGPETITLTLLSNAHYDLGTNVSGTVTIADVEPVSVSLSVSDANASESGDPATFILTRSGNSSSVALTVSFGWSGSASPGSDYSAPAGSIQIPQGASSVAVSVTPLPDALTEGSETVLLSLHSGAAYLLGSPSTGTVSIADVLLPSVSVAVSDGTASEGAGNSGSFTLTRSGATDATLAVSFGLSGSAVNGSDYAALDTSLSFAAGASTVVITISPLADSLAENSESVILSLNGGAYYTLGTPPSGAISITDSAAAANTVSVLVNDGSASEAAGNTGLISVARSGTKTAPLTVYFSLEGSAANGVDYTHLSSPVTIAAGAGSVALTFTALQDRLLEGNETATLRLSANAAYALGTTTSGTVTIVDVPPPTVSLTVTDTAASEAGNNNGVFTLNRSGSKTSAMAVSFTLSGSATNGSDYATLASPALIPAGASALTLKVSPLLDTLVEGAETVTLTVNPDDAYTLGTTSSGNVSIADVSPVSVTVTATDSAASESGDPGSFTITRSGSKTVPLTVSYTLAGSATNGVDYTALGGTLEIPANASSASLSLVPLADTTVEASETAVLSLSARSTYRVGNPASGSVTIANTGP